MSREHRGDPELSRATSSPESAGPRTEALTREAGGDRAGDGDNGLRARKIIRRHLRAAWAELSAGQLSPEQHLYFAEAALAEAEREAGRAYQEADRLDVPLQILSGDPEPLEHWVLPVQPSGDDVEAAVAHGRRLIGLPRSPLSLAELKRALAMLDKHTESNSHMRAAISAAVEAKRAVGLSCEQFPELRSVVVVLDFAAERITEHLARREGEATFRSDRGGAPSTTSLWLRAIDLVQAANGEGPRAALRLLLAVTDRDASLENSAEWDAIVERKERQAWSARSRRREDPRPSGLVTD